MRRNRYFYALWVITILWMLFFVGYLVNMWLTAFRQRQWLGAMSEQRQTELQFLLTGGIVWGGIAGVLIVQKSKRLGFGMLTAYALLLVAYVLWW